MIASIVQYVECKFFIISYFDFKFTSTYNSIQFCSVVFGVTSSLAVIDTIHWMTMNDTIHWTTMNGMCTVQDCAWSVSHCTQSGTIIVTMYSASRLVVQYPQ